MTERTTGMASVQDEGGRPPGDKPPEEKPLRLSHSKVEACDDCERYYFLLYECGMPRAPSLWPIYGKACHKALEVDLKRVRDEGAAPAPLSILIDIFHDAFWSMLAKDDPHGLLVGDPKLDWFYTRGMDAMRVYVQDVQRYVASREGGIRPLAVEHYFRFRHPDYPTIEFAGMIDVLTERMALVPGPGGPRLMPQRTMRDWKFIGKPWAKGKEHTSGQADAYLWAMHEGHVLDSIPGPKPDRVVFMTFPLREVVKEVQPDGSKEDVSPPTCYLEWRPTDRTESHRLAYADHVISVGERIFENGAQEEAYRPRVSPACGWCDMYWHCRPGQEFIGRKGLRVYTKKPPADAVPTPLDIMQEELL